MSKGKNSLSGFALLTHRSMLTKPDSEEIIHHLSLQKEFWTWSQPIGKEYEPIARSKTLTFTTPMYIFLF